MNVYPCVDFTSTIYIVDYKRTVYINPITQESCNGLLFPVHSLFVL